MSRETVFCQKVVTAFPIPFRILVRVVPKYRKGQIHARIRINFPARELAKRTLPMLSPKQRKIPVQRIPRIRQYWMVFSSVREICLWLPAACASETVGSSITEIELVMAEGKSTKGSAIPVSTP